MVMINWAVNKYCWWVNISGYTKWLIRFQPQSHSNLIGNIYIHEHFFLAGTPFPWFVDLHFPWQFRFCCSSNSVVHGLGIGLNYLKASLNNLKTENVNLWKLNGFNLVWLSNSTSLVQLHLTIRESHGYSPEAFGSSNLSSGCGGPDDGCYVHYRHLINGEKPPTQRSFTVIPFLAGWKTKYGYWILWDVVFGLDDERPYLTQSFTPHV